MASHEGKRTGVLTYRGTNILPNAYREGCIARVSMNDTTSFNSMEEDKNPTYHTLFRDLPEREGIVINPRFF